MKSKTILTAKPNPGLCKPDFTTIESICGAFGVNPALAKYGCRWRAGVAVPGRDINLWWPAESNDRYENTLSPNGLVFRSKDRNTSFEIGPILESAEKGEQKAIFLRPKKGGYGYRFVGIFRTNVEKSRKENRHVLDRVSDQIELLKYLST